MERVAERKVYETSSVERASSNDEVEFARGANLADALGEFKEYSKFDGRTSSSEACILQSFYFVTNQRHTRLRALPRRLNLHRLTDKKKNTGLT